MIELKQQERLSHYELQCLTYMTLHFIMDRMHMGGCVCVRRRPHSSTGPAGGRRNKTTRLPRTPYTQLDVGIYSIHCFGGHKLHRSVCGTTWALGHTLRPSFHGRWRVKVRRRGRRMRKMQRRHAWQVHKWHRYW